MLSNPSKDIGKKELDIYLRELGKEYRKLAGKKSPAEIVLIGGGAILANYNFRTSTTDVDAIIHAASAMKEAINRVGDKYYLANRWLNEDFVRTVSYSPKIEEFSQFYRQYSNVLQVRTIKAEYIIAMKLRAGRKYKNDFSDIIGVLMEHEEKNEHISYGDIDRAVINLYGSYVEVGHGIHIGDTHGAVLVGTLGDGIESDRKSTRLNSSHMSESRMPSSA